jgi:5-dehydro-2-deoxygluconokinase
MSTQLDLVTIGRVSVDLYGEQVGGRLEDVSTFAKAVGGCPANIAIGVARLGLKSGLITRVGDEPMGRFVLEQLQREGVNTLGVTTDPQRLTSLVLLGIRSEDSFPLIFYRDNCADSALTADDVDEQLVASSGAVLVTGTHFSRDGSAAAQAKAMQIARRSNRKVILDVDYRPNLWGIGGHGAGESRYARSSRVTAALAPHLKLCNLIVGTEEELHIAGGAEDTLQACRNIRVQSEAVIVCKRGAMGCVVLPGPIPNSLEDGIVGLGMPVTVYNVLGAGDAFMAGFLRGYLRDQPFGECIRYANACGAFAVSRLLCSTEYPTSRELNWYLEHGSEYPALRKDPVLNHLHWATTRRRQAVPERVRSVEVPGSRPLEFEHDSLATGLIEWPMEVTVKCTCLYHPDDPAELRAAQERELVRLAAVCRAQKRELLLEIIAGQHGSLADDTVAKVLARLYEIGIYPDGWQLEPEPGTRAWQACAEVITRQDDLCRGILRPSSRGS